MVKKLDFPSLLKKATDGIYSIHLGHILISITDKQLQTILEGFSSEKDKLDLMYSFKKLQA